MLFGLSGLGKSSLLQAGLFPRLRAEQYFPVYIRLDYSPAELPESGGAGLGRRSGARRRAAAHRGAGGQRAGDTLWARFHRTDADFWDERNRPVTPLLVFDQFEEIFTLGRRDRRAVRPPSGSSRSSPISREGGAVGADVAGTAARPRRSCARCADDRYRLLICIRSDYLAQLQAISDRVRAVFANRYELRRMSGAAALRSTLTAGAHRAGRAGSPPHRPLRRWRRESDGPMRLVEGWRSSRRFSASSAASSMRHAASRASRRSPPRCSPAPRTRSSRASTSRASPTSRRSCACWSRTSWSRATAQPQLHLRADRTRDGGGDRRGPGEARPSAAAALRGERLVTAAGADARPAHRRGRGQPVDARAAAAARGGAARPDHGRGAGDVGAPEASPQPWAALVFLVLLAVAVAGPFLVSTLDDGRREQGRRRFRVPYGCAEARLGRAIRRVGVPRARGPSRSRALRRAHAALRAVPHPFLAGADPPVRSARKRRRRGFQRRRRPCRLRGRSDDRGVGRGPRAAHRQPRCRIRAFPIYFAPDGWTVILESAGGVRDVEGQKRLWSSRTNRSVTFGEVATIGQQGLPIPMSGEAWEKASTTQSTGSLAKRSTCLLRRRRQRRR